MTTSTPSTPSPGYPEEFLTAATGDASDVEQASQAGGPTDLGIFGDRESDVRSYSRDWPAVFSTARGATVRTDDGREYLDFFAGAGALNYGHNDPDMKKALLEYLEGDGIVHGLDMFTPAKARFLQAFTDTILAPRSLNYKVQFPGPTGTNAVETALKLARKVTGREAVLNFTNAFHGMTLGSLSVTGNAMKRAGAGVPLVHATPMPYDNYLEDTESDFRWMERVLDDSGSGMNRPAAVIVETIQGEGGVNVARVEWLQGLEKLCRERDILLIIDDVQMGCGRTGEFFSFEAAGIRPDIVTLSKSISGYGLPMALTLFRPELDVWGPGEHNGTFRGNNAAFVTAAVTLEKFWSDDTLTRRVHELSEKFHAGFEPLAEEFEDFSQRGRGLAHGLVFATGEQASAVSEKAFEAGLLTETSGPEGEVVKLLPPLILTDEEATRGIDILVSAAREVLGS